MRTQKPIFHATALLPALTLLFTCLCTGGEALAANALKNNPSPYLAMHGEDPVAWREWNEAVVKTARQRNKLLFVSIGYFSCHWCHVMQRESYQDAEIAKILNTHFVPVKVDRELNPALDARLIEFVERTRGYSGWPLNVFVTPEGFPLIGIVYLPPAEFKDLIGKLRDLWETDWEQLKYDAEAAAGALRGKLSFPNPKLAPGLYAEVSASFVSAALAKGDDMRGGFGEQSKFPSVPQLAALLRLHAAKPDPRVKALLELSLDNMARRGLADALGGGFFRYTVDPDWRVPHFEKMLYDNALLAKLYLDAARDLREPAYRSVGLRTLDFMLRELAQSDGALAASLSALDAKQVEGGYYLWREEELNRHLDADEYAAVRAAWQMGSGPVSEHGYLPMDTLDEAELAAQTGKSPAQARMLLLRAADKLRLVRATRLAPIDGKKLAAWNGLALSALSVGAGAAPDGPYRKAAQALRDFIVGELWDGERLTRAPGGLGRVTIEDYAYVAAGVWDWAQLSKEPRDAKLAGQIARGAWKRFHTDYGWRLSEDSLLGYGGEQSMIADGPMPSPSAGLIKLSLEIAASEKAADLRERALVALNAAPATLTGEPFWFASYVDALAIADGNLPAGVSPDSADASRTSGKASALRR